MQREKNLHWNRAESGVLSNLVRGQKHGRQDFKGGLNRRFNLGGLKDAQQNLLITAFQWH
jgi:hypothetical protein